VGEEGLDLAKHRRAVGLRRQQIVAAPVEDHPGGAFVGMHRVAGDEQAVERQRLGQGPGREGLVLVLGHYPVGDSDLRAAAEGRDDSAERPAARSKERRSGLPSIVERL
jgi:hypothetical protein